MSNYFKNVIFHDEMFDKHSLNLKPNFFFNAQLTRVENYLKKEVASKAFEYALASV